MMDWCSRRAWLDTVLLVDARALDIVHHMGGCEIRCCGYGGSRHGWLRWRNSGSLEELGFRALPVVGIIGYRISDLGAWRVPVTRVGSDVGKRRWGSW